MKSYFMENNIISIIIPVYNEEENISVLYREIVDAMSDLKYSFEIVFVDDSSTDNSWNEIKKLTKMDCRVKAIRFTRNFGQTTALKAGIDVSRGSIIITMDSDLQNDPRDIPRLIKMLNQGFDLVNGWRKYRKDPYSKIIPSKIANYIISMITGIKLNDYGCSLKAYRKEILSDIELYGEMHRFLPALCGYKGARITEIEVNHRPRIKGKSKYGLERVFKVILDLIVVKFIGSFISKPIYFFGLFSFSFLAISSVFFLITLYNKWYNHIFVKDQPLFLVAIFLALIGVQLGLIGVVAEMITRVYYNGANKKTYYIKETENI